jgi:aminoglycoside phosphotransferase (APT) family kinase protein
MRARRAPARPLVGAPEARVALAERIQAVAEREIAAVEQVLTILGASDPSETEAAARTLASLARTLRELRQLDTTMTTSEPIDDEPVPRDIDELRRSLARKLDALIAGEQAEVPGEP